MANGNSAVDRSGAPQGDGRASAGGAGPQLERLGGARADFVAHLGRRVADLTALLKQLLTEPDSARLRDDLRRRMHALAAAARLLRFARLADEVATGETLLAASAERGRLSEGDQTALRALLDRVPSLAWGEAWVGEITPAPGRVSEGNGTGPRSNRASVVQQGSFTPRARTPAAAAPASGPVTVLVVGPHTLAEALNYGAGDDRFEIELTGDHAAAIELARVVAPDVILVDADRPGAIDLVRAITTDPLTEATPILVAGRFAKPDEASTYVALGVARALPKPISPDALRRAAGEVAATYVRREIVRAPLGQITLDELGNRLAEELRRGLCDAAVGAGRTARLDLGEGSEVLAALWGAVARIRDLCTIQSAGEVRFSPSGPEGALPVAAWSGTEQRADGRSTKPNDARAASGVRLEGKTIVVADDDPAVTWFLAGVLRAAGAIVHEAHDGTRALEIAFRVTPDLVISDVVMPALDGFALCRALRRDLVLRDVPVILLSWKEDLLQRVRELGADADGYLRKEASAAAIVQRVREVMRARQRVAERIAGHVGDGSEAGPRSVDLEVRGRLDGLTARTLLGLACGHRPDAMVTVRDAAFLYEVEIRGGRPVRASRAAADGSFERGPSALAALLGVGAGRFVVAPLPIGEALPAELDGGLDEQLLPMIAAARAAQRLLSGASLAGVERVTIDERRMAVYLGATPEPARALLKSLVGGASPRALLGSGQFAPRLVEDVLCDAAAHGAVIAVADADGVDRLDAAIDREIAILRGARLERLPMPEPVLDLGPIMATALPGPVEIPRSPAPSPTATAVRIADDEDDDDDDGPPAGEKASQVEAMRVVPIAEPVSDAPSTTPSPAASGPRVITPPLPFSRALTPPPATVAVAAKLSAKASLRSDPRNHAGHGADDRGTLSGMGTLPATAVRRDLAEDDDAIDRSPVSAKRVHVVEDIRFASPARLATPIAALPRVAPAPAARPSVVIPPPPMPAARGLEGISEAETPVGKLSPSVNLVTMMSSTRASGSTGSTGSTIAPPKRPLTPPPLPLPSVAPPALPRALDETENPTVQRLSSLGSLVPPPVVAHPRVTIPKAPPLPRLHEETAERNVAGPSRFGPSPEPEPVAAPSTPALAHKDSATSRTMWMLFAVAGVVFAVGARVSRDRQVIGTASVPALPAAELAPAAAAPVAMAPVGTAEPVLAAPPPRADVRPAASAAAPRPLVQGASKENPILPVDAPLGADDKVAPGEGMVEVTVGASDAVYVDKVLVGVGPVVKRSLASRREPYEIRVRLRGEERVRFAVVKEGRLTRLRIAPPWSR